jgi:hypothetical protein
MVFFNKKPKTVHVGAMKASGGSRGLAPLILNFGVSQR